MPNLAVHPLVKFEEIQVFEGIAERTGNVVDRDTIRGSNAICRSIMELTNRARRLGDGTFYLKQSIWPEGKDKLELAQTWTTMS